MEQFKDRDGIPFAEYRIHIPKRISHYRADVVRKQPEVAAQLHYDYDYCFVCGRKRMRHFGERAWLEAHHIVGGSCRSDERANLMLLCNPNGCHDHVKTESLPNGLLLWWRWRIEPQTISWVRLALLMGKSLPNLIEATEDQINEHCMNRGIPFLPFRK